MALHISAAASSQMAFTHNMSNVIDSLKRLERIGSEESQTVQKILEAAKELSQVIWKHFPRSLQNKPIVAHINEAEHLPREKLMMTCSKTNMEHGVDRLQNTYSTNMKSTRQPNALCY